MPTILQTLGLTTKEALLLIQEGERQTEGGSRRVRDEMLEFVKTPEGKKFLNSELENLNARLEDDAYMSLVREFGEGSAGKRQKGDKRSTPQRRRRTVERGGKYGSRFESSILKQTAEQQRPIFSQKEVKERKREILEERVDNLRTRAKVEEQIRKGVIDPTTEMSRQQEDFPRLGEDPDKARMDMSERASLFDQKITKEQGGRTAATNKDLVNDPTRVGRGGTSTRIYQRKATDPLIAKMLPDETLRGGDLDPTVTTVISETEYNTRRAETYDIEFEGVDGNPRIHNHERFTDDFREGIEGPRNLRGASRQAIATTPPREGQSLSQVTPEQAIAEKRRAVGGIKKMITLKDLPAKQRKKLKNYLPNIGNYELYRTPTGLRVIVPGFSNLGSQVFDTVGFEVSRFSEEERSTLSGKSKDRTHRNKKIGNLIGPSFDESDGMDLFLKERNAVEIEPGSDLEISIRDQIKKGRIELPAGGHNLRFFRIPGAAAGSFVAVMDKRSGDAVKGTKKPKRVLRKTVMRQVEDGPIRITKAPKGEPEPALTATRLKGIEASEIDRQRGNILMSGDYTGMQPSEASEYARKVARQIVKNDGVGSTPKNIDEFHPIERAAALEKANKAVNDAAENLVAQKGPAAIIADDIKRRRAAIAAVPVDQVSSAQVRRIEHLEATLDILKNEVDSTDALFDRIARDTSTRPPTTRPEIRELRKISSFLEGGTSKFATEVAPFPYPMLKDSFNLIRKLL